MIVSRIPSVLSEDASGWKTAAQSRESRIRGPHPFPLCQEPHDGRIVVRNLDWDFEAILCYLGTFHIENDASCDLEYDLERHSNPFTGEHVEDVLTKA